MNIKRVTLHITEMKLVSPFVTSYGAYRERQSILIEMEDKDGCIGWGEVVAFFQPWYTEETTQTALHMLQEFLVPILLGKSIEHPSGLSQLFSNVKRNRMAKAGLEGAVWDLYAQHKEQPLAAVLGGVRSEIEVGVVVGIDTLPHMLRQMERYAAEGYQRFKVKIKPRYDYELLQGIRQAFPDLSLMADANSAYTLQDKEQLKKLDDFGLMMIEQPLSDDDILDHALLQKELETPICLDESVHSLQDARVAITLGSCRIVNIKAGRVGGLTEAIRIHDYCREHHIPVWCGGMIETGISRAQNVALASLPNFTIPGDISASSRHWEEDVIIPDIKLCNGRVHVSSTPGLGYEVNRKRLKDITLQTIILES